MDQSADEIKQLMHRNIVEPVVFVVTKTNDGKVNFMPCGWNMKVSYEPPTLAISVFKDSSTHHVLLETGEFVVCVPTADMEELIMYASSVHGDDVDKVGDSGEQMSESVAVSPPRIERAKLSYECRVSQVVDVGTATLFIAEILYAHSTNGPDQLYYSHKSPDKKRIFGSVVDTHSTTN